MEPAHPAHAAVRIQRQPDHRDVQADAQSHAVQQLRDAGHAQHSDASVPVTQFLQQRLEAGVHPYIWFDMGVAKERTYLVHKAVLRAPFADHVQFAGTRAAVCVQIAKAIRKEGNLAFRCSEGLSPRPVRELDQEHIYMVLFFGREEGSIPSFEQGQLPEMGLDLGGMGSQDLSSGCYDEVEKGVAGHRSAELFS